MFLWLYQYLIFIHFFQIHITNMLKHFQDICPPSLFFECTFINPICHIILFYEIIFSNLSLRAVSRIFLITLGKISVCSHEQILLPMQSFAHFDCNNQVLLNCSFTYISLPFLPILNVFIIVNFPYSCNGIPLTSFLRFYKFTERNKFSNVLDILKSNLLYINQGLNTLSQSFSAKSLPYLHALSHA